MLGRLDLDTDAYHYSCRSRWAGPAKCRCESQGGRCRKEGRLAWKRIARSMFMLLVFCCHFGSWISHSLLFEDIGGRPVHQNLSESQVSLRGLHSDSHTSAVLHCNRYHDTGRMRAVRLQLGQNNPWRPLYRRDDILYCYNIPWCCLRFHGCYFTNACVVEFADADAEEACIDRFI